MLAEMTALTGNDLAVPMASGTLRLEPLAEKHREPLKRACAADSDIWRIYPVSMMGDAFDPGFDAMCATVNRVPFAIVLNGETIGMTSYFVDAANRVVEIGGSFITPRLRGSGVNPVVKRMMLERAFSQGFIRVEFRIDTRNHRSLRAVERLGAKREGVLRRNRITWTGYFRDTAIYSILADEWPDVEHGLRLRSGDIGHDPQVKGEGP